MKVKIAIISTLIILGILIVLNLNVIRHLSTLQTLKRNNNYLHTTYSEHIISENDSTYIVPYTMRYKELELHHPYGEPIDKNESSFLVEQFENQITLTIIPNNSSESMRTYEEFFNDSTKALLIKQFGPTILESEYHLFRNAFQTNPDDISWLKMSNNRLLANMWLLLIKQLYLPNHQGPILNFETERVQGFQFTIHNKNTLLKIYDSNGLAQNHYHILINGEVSQEKIDFIIKNITFTYDQ